MDQSCLNLCSHYSHNLTPFAKPNNSYPFLSSIHSHNSHLIIYSFLPPKSNPNFFPIPLSRIILIFEGRTHIVS